MEPTRLCCCSISKTKVKAGAPLSEFRQVLPSLPMKAVQKLLEELRNEGGDQCSRSAALGPLVSVRCSRL